MTPELLDLARERGSGFVAVMMNGELVEFSWDGTLARWDDILGAISEIDDPVLYVGVVTEGITINNQTYEAQEHLTMVVIHPAGWDSYKIDLGKGHEDSGVTTLDLGVGEMDFNLPALLHLLPW